MNTIISVILIIISIATFYLYINPLYVGTKDQDGIKQLIEKRDKISLRNNKIEEIRKKKKELRKDFMAVKATNEDAVSRLERMIPNNMENARLINYINSIKMGSQSTQISDIRITADVGNNKQKKGKIVISKQKDYKSVNLGFTFVSDYKNFKKFISDLYKSLRVVDIVSINIEPQDKRRKDFSSDNFTFNIIVRTYWLNNNN